MRCLLRFYVALFTAAFWLVVVVAAVMLVSHGPP